MTDTPKVPETPETLAAETVEEIIELVFRTNPLLIIAAFVAGALVIAGVVYLIGTRMQEGETDAAD